MPGLVAVASVINRFRTPALLAAVASASCAEPAGDPAPRRLEDGSISRQGSHEGPAAFDTLSGGFYFTRANADFTVSTIWFQRSSPFGESVPAPFSTGVYDAGVTFHPVERRAVFTSKRTTGVADLPDEWNLWAARVDSSAARPLPPPVNTAASECCAAFAPDGSLLFSSDREGSWDIFRAQDDGAGRYLVTRLGGSINSEHDEWVSYSHVDGLLILFSSIRPDGRGGDDVYAACRDPSGADVWRSSILDPPINSDAYEDSPVLTPDGNRLLWSSRRPRGDGSADGDVFVMEAGPAGLPDCSGLDGP